MKAKRILSLLMSAVLVGGLLAACGSGSGSSEETTAAAGASTTAAAGGTATEAAGGGETTAAVDGSIYEVTEPIEVEYWYGSSRDEAYYNDLAEKFNASQEYVTVKPISFIDYSAITEQLSAAQAAGTGLPALTQMSVDQLATYMDSGVCEPLDGYLDYYGVDTDDFVDAFRDVGTWNGSTYGMPNGVSVAVFFYNKSALAEYGLDKFPETWEEFKTWVKDVHDATGKVAYTCAAKQSNILYNFLINWGGSLVKEDGTSGFDNETLKQYIKEMKELVDAGYVEWSMEGVEAVGNKFLTQETMCVNISCTSYDAYITDDFDVAVGWNYMGEKNISSVAGSYIFIPAQLSQQEKNAGFLFMNYLTSPDQNLDWVKATSYLVTHKSVIEDEAKMQEVYDTLPEMKTVYDHWDDYIKKEQSPYFAKVMKPYMEAICQIILENADFDETWSGMLEEVNYILAGN